MKRFRYRMVIYKFDCWLLDVERASHACTFPKYGHRKFNSLVVPYFLRYPDRPFLRYLRSIYQVMDGYAPDTHAMQCIAQVQTWLSIM